MTSPRALGALVSLSLLAGGCSSSSSSSPAGSASAAACSVDGGTDGGGATCTVARHSLSCSNGAETALCLSEDGAACPEAAMLSGQVTCQDVCAASEYGAFCGSPGTDLQAPEPPAGCRLSLATPGGVLTYCCPCP